MGGPSVGVAPITSVSSRMCGNRLLVWTGLEVLPGATGVLIAMQPTPFASPVRAESLVLLAPTAAAVPDHFADIEVDADRHAALLRGLQRLRGQVYLHDEAIGAEQLQDGCHVQASDDSSWHVVSLQPDGSIAACARLRTHRPDSQPESLGVWSSALAHSVAWSGKLRQAIEADLRLARLRDVLYVEAGGWAVGAEFRGTTMAVTTAMSTYALGYSLGGFVGLTTATVRHCSSRMMRKLGGHSFTVAGEAVPTYFDPQYGCEMELLRFDSAVTSHRYGAMLGQVIRTMQNVPVVCATAAAEHGGQLVRAASRAALVARHVPCYVPGELAATA